MDRKEINRLVACIRMLHGISDAEASALVDTAVALVPTLGWTLSKQTVEKILDEMLDEMLGPQAANGPSSAAGDAERQRIRQALRDLASPSHPRHHSPTSSAARDAKERQKLVQELKKLVEPKHPRFRGLPPDMPQYDAQLIELHLQRGLPIEECNRILRRRFACARGQDDTFACRRLADILCWFNKGPGA